MSTGTKSMRSRLATSPDSASLHCPGSKVSIANLIIASLSTWKTTKMCLEIVSKSHLLNGFRNPLTLNFWTAWEGRHHLFQETNQNWWWEQVDMELNRINFDGWISKHCSNSHKLNKRVGMSRSSLESHWANTAASGHEHCTIYSNKNFRDGSEDVEYIFWGKASHGRNRCDHGTTQANLPCTSVLGHVHHKMRWCKQIPRRHIDPYWYSILWCIWE